MLIFITAFLVAGFYLLTVERSKGRKTTELKAASLINEPGVASGEAYKLYVYGCRSNEVCSYQSPTKDTRFIEYVVFATSIIMLSLVAYYYFASIRLNCLKLIHYGQSRIELDKIELCL